MTNWRQTCCVILALSGAPSHVLLAKTAPSSHVLSAPPESRTLETVTRGILAVGQASGQLVMATAGQADLLIAPFQPPAPAAATTREAIFGALTAQKRVLLSEGAARTAWRGLDLSASRPLALDGENFSLHELDPKTWTRVISRTIAWDMIKPPRDRGGEPTQPETAALRAKFKRAYMTTLGIKAAGFAPLPEGRGITRSYLVALRVAGFPLALLECEKDAPSACILARQCYLEGAADLAPEAITGLAIRAKDRMVFIGDRTRRRIVGFKFESCYHVPKKVEYGLPDRLKELRNLSIDADGRLWVATAAPDDYLNASLYFWNEGEW